MVIPHVSLPGITRAVGRFPNILFISVGTTHPAHLDFHCLGSFRQLRKS